MSQTLHIFIGLESFEKVLQVCKIAKQDLGEILRSCELADNSSMESVQKHLKLKSPLLPERYPFYMLVETAGSNETHDEEKMGAFLERLMTEGYISNGLSTSEPAKVKVSTFRILPSLQLLF